MAIVTKDPHTWVVISDPKSGKKMTVFSNETPEHDFTIPFEVNFSDAATPASNTVTFYNISKKHASFPKKGMKIRLYFNWGSSKKLICEGYITKADDTAHDGVSDTKVLTYTEGTNYSNVKANRLKVEKKKTVGKGKTRKTKTERSNKVYKKGTTYKTLIKGIASQCGIKIDRIQLHRNPKLKHAFTAKGKPLTLIKRLVKKTESVINYRKGKFEIIDPKSEKRTWIDIDDQDLIQPPSSNESDDGKKTYEINTPLIPEITVGVGIHMKSKYLKGRYYVRAGQHTSDGENPQTQCSIAAM